MAFDTASDYIVFFGAVIGVAGFSGGFSAAALLARFRAHHEHDHDLTESAMKESRGEILKAIKALDEKVTINSELVKDAISVILIEGGQQNPAWLESIRVRSPVTYRVFVQQEEE